MGKLIVLDGLDGSGKGTQCRLLEEFLRQKEKNFKKINLPDYESPSSALVKMYLNGAFGGKPMEVNAYASSAFYAVDRFANYTTSWKELYQQQALILADRYTTSNVVHQMVKLPREQWDEYIHWLYDFEFTKMRLPKPDLVIYLDMRPDISQKLLSSRYNGDETKKDIHEKDLAYLRLCRQAALYGAQALGWQVIACFEENTPLPKEEITKKILQLVDKLV